MFFLLVSLYNMDSTVSLRIDLLFLPTKRQDAVLVEMKFELKTFSKPPTERKSALLPVLMTATLLFRV